MLQSMGSQRVGHDLVTEQQQRADITYLVIPARTGRVHKHSQSQSKDGCEGETLCLSGQSAPALPCSLPYRSCAGDHIMVWSLEDRGHLISFVT